MRADPRASTMIRLPRDAAVAHSRWMPMVAMTGMAVVVSWRASARRDDLLGVVVVSLWPDAEAHAGRCDAMRCDEMTTIHNARIRECG